MPYGLKLAPRFARSEISPALFSPPSFRGGSVEGGGKNNIQTQFKNLQRKLRKNMPAPEIVLWQKIRNKQLGVKFRRQYTIGSKILDFYSPEIKLGIEIDGTSHFINEKSRQKEIERDRKLLEEQNIKVARLLNTEVMQNLEGVILKILEEIKNK